MPIFFDTRDESVDKGVVRPNIVFRPPTRLEPLASEEGCSSNCETCGWDPEPECCSGCGNPDEVVVTGSKDGGDGGTDPGWGWGDTEEEDVDLTPLPRPSDLPVDPKTGYGDDTPKDDFHDDCDNLEAEYYILTDVAAALQSQIDACNNLSISQKWNKFPRLPGMPSAHSVAWEMRKQRCAVLNAALQAVLDALQIVKDQLRTSGCDSIQGFDHNE